MATGTAYSATARFAQLGRPSIPIRNALKLSPRCPVTSSGIVGRVDPVRDHRSVVAFSRSASTLVSSTGGATRNPGSCNDGSGRQLSRGAVGVSRLFYWQQQQQQQQQQRRAFSSLTTGETEFYDINADNTVSCKIPVSIPEVFPRFTDFLWQNTDQFGDRVALICPSTNSQWTHSQVRDLSKRFGARLVELEILRKHGDAFAVISPNSLGFAVGFYGALSVGGVASPNNPIYVKEELAHNFSLADPKGVLTTSKQLDVVLDAISLRGRDNHVTAIVLTDVASEADIHPSHKVPAGCKLYAWDNFLQLKDGIAHGAAQDVLLPGAKENFCQHELAVLPFSSGTTGLAKGVHLSHRSLGANLLQCRSPALTKFLDRETLIGLLPFFHIYGMNMILAYSTYAGCKTVLMEKFDPDALLDILMKYKPTMFHLVPPILQFLAKSPKVKKEHLSSLVTICCGAAPSAPTLIKELVEKFQLESNFQEGYGMTEASPVTHWLPYTSKMYGSCGGPLPGTVSAIRDVSTGKFLGPNQRGEVVVKGPQVMVRYHKNPKATDETITEDGWLLTGDIGYYDENGFFFVVDRVKELIKVKGLQVAPAELEDLLHKHPLVADVAVIGIPHDKLGEAPRAFVIPKTGPDGKPVEVDPEEVAEMVKTHVSEHKYLAGGVEVVSALPKSQTGKILRRVLKEEYMKRAQQV